MLGNVERIDEVAVTGWVFDPLNPNQHHKITIFYDETVLSEVIANQSRPDLSEAGVGNGDHAFIFLFENIIKDFDPSLIRVETSGHSVPIDDRVSVTFRATIQEVTDHEEKWDTLVELVSGSGLFSPTYAKRHVSKERQSLFEADPVRYFLNDKTFSIKPHPLFDTKWYYQEYLSEISTNMHPLVHYISVGISKGNRPNYAFIPEWYLSYLSKAELKKAENNPVLHYHRVGWKAGACPHPMFSPSWYISQHADVKNSNIEPLSHYLDLGCKEQRKFHPLMDSKYYSRFSGDQSTVLDHFWRLGVLEGHAPHELLYYPSQRSDRKSPYRVPAKLDGLQAWVAVNAINTRRDIHVRTAINSTENPPLLSVVVPVYDPPLDVFRNAINTVLSQSYTNFELIIVDDASKNKYVRSEISRLETSDSRVKTIFHSSNRHISHSTNDAVNAASGEYIVFFDHDDVMMPHALGILAFFIRHHDSPDVLFSDDCRTDISGANIQAARFKPSWSPETLLSYSYASHLRAVKRATYHEVGGTRIGLEGSQDHDMFLRLAAAKVTATHIPYVLYGRRAVPGSTALSGAEKPYAFDAGRAAVKDAFAHRGMEVDVTRPDWAIRSNLGIYKPIMPHSGPRVTLIVPTRNNMRTLVRLIRSLPLTLYTNYDLLIVDNQSDDPDTISYLKQIPYNVVTVPNKDNDFNFSYLNNTAVRSIDTEFVLFLNDDTEVLSPDWLSQMMGWAQLDNVGVVGARLLFGDRRVQHGGVSPSQTVGYTMFRGLAGAEHGYLSLASVARNCSAVTAACMLTRRDLFEELGGFDEENFGVAFNDVDYCLRVREAGLRVVYCGEAELFHHEGTSRPKKDKPAEIAAFKTKYRDFVDPYLNPNLSRDTNRMDVVPRVLPLPVSPTPKNVLFVSHNFNLEGAPNSLFEIVQGLTKLRNVRPTVVGPVAGPLLSAYRQLDVEVIIQPNLIESLKVGSADEYNRQCRLFSDSVGIQNFDVVFANTAEMHTAINAARMSSVPSVWCIREGESWNGYYSRLAEPLEIEALGAFRFPYRVVFVSKASYNNWSDLNTNGNFAVIQNGLDLERFEQRVSGIDRVAERRKLGFSDNDIVILALGGLIPRKGQHDLILALPRLPHDILRRIQVVMVGARNNPYYERISRTIEGFPGWLRDRIMVVPEATNVGRFYVVSDVFFCGSRMESYPRIILEAEAAGLPIIATPTAGIPEQIVEGENGLFYEAGRLEMLCSHIRQLVENQHARTEMGKASRIVLDTLTTYPSMLRQYASIIDEAAISNMSPI